MMLDIGIGSAWIGAGSTNGSVYRYISGPPVPMGLWMIDEPDLNHGACVYLSVWVEKLGTTDCDEQLSFVCEIKTN